MRIPESFNISQFFMHALGNCKLEGSKPESQNVGILPVGVTPQNGSRMILETFGEFRKWRQWDNVFGVEPNLAQSNLQAYRASHTVRSPYLLVGGFVREVHRNRF